MTKKVLLGLGAIAVAVAVLPMFAAFEAHVVNVTATIENALSVPLDPIRFGTVFPQEELNKLLEVALSGSFRAEERVDDVEYMIRQKPKCAWTWQDEGQNDAWIIDENSTQTGHVVVVGEDSGPWTTRVDCGNPEKPANVPPGALWGELPSLCKYISKHGDVPEVDRDGIDLDGNDGSLASFHQPYQLNGNKLVWTEVHGRLAKSIQDFNDTWVIDLAVPCFGGYCAQDWDKFVHDINPDAGDSNQWTQPKENEHKVFGCDLWVEVTGVSEVDTEPAPECSDGLDNDGDNFMDDQDPGCYTDGVLYNPTDNDETDPLPE